MYENVTLKEIKELVKELRVEGKVIGNSLKASREIIERRIDAPEWVRTAQRAIYPKLLLLRQDLREIIADIKEEAKI